MRIVCSESFRLHRTPPGHPESIARYASVMDALTCAGLTAGGSAAPGSGIEVVEAREAAKDELASVHKPDYLDRIERFCAAGGGALDPDTYAVPESWAAATKAAGACIQGVEYVLGPADSNVRTALCLVRPPGHHARPSAPMGFCLFNNVAVGAAVAIKRFGAERVLIVDWDLHHGNGTQEIFYEDPKVFYFSMHRWPFWPGTGSAAETGRGPGKGFTLNLPLAAGTSRSEIRSRFRESLQEIASRFAPKLVMISAGFDMHRADPLGGLSLEAEDYGEMTHELADLFMKMGSAGLVSSLEGGYDLAALGASATAHAKALLSLNAPRA